jgi:hypothetical protein
MSLSLSRASRVPAENFRKQAVQGHGKKLIFS